MLEQKAKGTEREPRLHKRECFEMLLLSRRSSGARQGRPETHSESANCAKCKIKCKFEYTAAADSRRLTKHVLHGMYMSALQTSLAVWTMETKYH